MGQLGGEFRVPTGKLGHGGQNEGSAWTAFMGREKWWGPHFCLITFVGRAKLWGPNLTELKNRAWRGK